MEIPGFITTILNFISSAKTGIYACISIALLFSGYQLLLSGAEGKEKAKKSLPWVGVGSFLALGCIEIAKWVQSNISF